MCGAHKGKEKTNQNNRKKQNKRNEKRKQKKNKQKRPPKSSSQFWCLEILWHHFGKIIDQNFGF